MYQQNYQGAMKNGDGKTIIFTPPPLLSPFRQQNLQSKQKMTSILDFIWTPSPSPALVTSFLSGPFIQMRNYRWQYHIIE